MSSSSLNLSSSETDISSINCQESTNTLNEESTDFVKISHQDPKIAKLTLEMFMNNSYYTKYLSTSDPNAYKEHQGFLDAILRHRYSIIDITHQLLDHPETQITSPVLEAFRDYANACIKYIELKELEERAEITFEDGDREWSDGESDHEPLFSSLNLQNNDDIENNKFIIDPKENEDELSPFPKSFWGPTIKKQTIRKNNDLTENLDGKSFWGDIRAFSNNRR